MDLATARVQIAAAYVLYPDMRYLPSREEPTEMFVPVLRLSGARWIALMGCCFIAATVPAPAQRFKGPTYSLMPPAGWTTTTQNVAKGGVAFIGPREQEFTVNINLLSEPAPHETLAQYVQANHRQVAAHKEMGMTILKDGKTVMAGGAAHTMLSELHLANRPNVPTLRTVQVYAMHKDRAYILTLTYPKSVAEPSRTKYVAAFDKMVASFHWER